MRSFAQQHPNLRGFPVSKPRREDPRVSSLADNIAALVDEVAAKPSIEDVTVVVEAATQEVVAEVTELRERVDVIEADAAAGMPIEEVPFG